MNRRLPNWSPLLRISLGSLFKRLLLALVLSVTWCLLKDHSERNLLTVRYLPTKPEIFHGKEAPKGNRE
jgi:hypothetical protein